MGAHAGTDELGRGRHTPKDCCPLWVWPDTPVFILHHAHLPAHFQAFDQVFRMS